MALAVGEGDAPDPMVREVRKSLRLARARCVAFDALTRLPARRLFDLRHTYATWSLAAGVDLFTLSRRMGTSLAM
jgi:integrase